MNVSAGIHNVTQRLKKLKKSNKNRHVICELALAIQELEMIADVIAGGKEGGRRK